MASEVEDDGEVVPNHEDLEPKTLARTEDEDAYPVV